MKKFGISYILGLTAILFMTSSADAAAVTPMPALKLTDSLGNTIVIDGNGVATYGGNCTPTTCTTTSVTVAPGFTTWAGTIGAFSLGAVAGTTKPASTPNPSQDLSLQSITTATGGTLTIQWTDTGFNYSDIGSATIAAGGVVHGSGSATFASYFDNTNVPFGTGIPIGNLGPFTTGSFNGSVTGPGPTATPFSMTESVTLTLGPGASFGVDDELIPLPAPLKLICASNAAEVGVLYNSSLMAVGGITPYTYSITGGSLPNGLTLNPLTGAITGTPTMGGTAGFTAQVLDSSDGSASTASSTCSIVVTTPPPIGLSCPVTTGTVNVPFSSALAGTGGIPPYTYSIKSGSLPNGLTLNPNGSITGTPTQPGPFSFVGQVQDSTGTTAGATTSNCGVTIGTLPSASCVAINAIQNVPITMVTLSATGGTGTGYTFTATGLPTGLTISSVGTISGTPTVSGTFPYTVTITDSAGNKGTLNCSVTVNPPISATCVVINATQNVAITPVTMTASGGTGTGYTFSASGLPSGLTMSTGGTISGTPTVSGTFPYTVTITDSNGNTGSFNCSVTVNPPVNNNQAITASCVVVNAIQNVAITPVTMIASGGTGTGYTFVATGLPTGLTMSSGGTLSGTPTVTGTFPYTVTITDSAGDKSTFNCSITVYPPVSATCVVINAIQNVAITPVTMTATGGTGTGYTFVATGLPTGLTMSSGGTISGTPTVSGTFPYTVTVTDSAGHIGTFNCSVTVNPPISATCVVINAIQNVAITPVTMTATGGSGTGYTFSATGLPTGLTMSSGGTISGTPTVSGTFPYTVTVTDSAGHTGTFNCSVTVYPPISATCVVINATQNVAITPVTMTATGGTGTGYTFVATGLPTGLTMSSGGTISGTPTVSGTFPYTVTVTDSGGNKGTFNCSVTVNPPISATCVVINATQNVAITPVTMTATGGTGTGYTFSATGLPTGLTMSSSGTISGTPTVSGTFPYTVTVTDSAGNKGTFNCSVTVTPVINATCVVINAVQNVAIAPVTMTATGGTGTGYTFVATGLPTGLTMSAGGTISGTPTASGTFPYTVTVTDSGGNTGSFNCSVTVYPPVSATCVVINAIQNVAITPVTMTATGGTGSGYTFSATGLPSGLTMSTAGTISGTPTVSGTFPYTVTVTDSGGHTGTFNCSVTVAPPVSATCVVINAVQNVAITPVTMTATGGTGSGYTFSATGLPTGLTMSISGTISGTPTVSGTFPYTVTVTDSAGHTGTFNCSVAVAPPVSATCVVINAIQNVAITPVTMTATGGTGSGYTFSATGLPTGLTMSSGGTISGTPTASGTFPYTVTVTDSAGNQGTFNCSVTVYPPISATCVVINAIQNVPITPVTMTATGGTGTGYTFSATGLPTGLTMSAAGTISGTPTVSGTFPYTVTVTDSAGHTGTFNCSVTVAPPVSATCVVINAIQNVAITPVTMTATGGTGSGYTFSATGLPTGLTMSTNGTISGTPTVSGTFPYTVTVTDSGGHTGTFNCSVTVAPPVSATCVVINAIQNVAITPVTMTATGGTGTGYTFSATGLPTGLTMSSGTISGTPTVSGTFPYTVTVTDSAGHKGTFNCSVTVAPPPTPLSLLCPTGTAQLNTAYSSTAAVSGGVAPYTFSVATGSLPPGLTLNTSSGAITGIPTAAGTFGFAIQVKDSTGATAISACTSACNATATWNFNVPSGTLGNSQAYNASGMTITAYGFTSGGSPAALFGKNNGGDQNGLGFNGVSGNEIDTSHFIQIDLANVIAKGAQNAQLVINSVQSGGGYKIYGSNTLGSLGTLLTSGSLDNTAFAVPAFANYRYIGVIASSYNVLLGAVSFTMPNCAIVVTPPVNLQCGSCGGNKATIGTAYSEHLSAAGGNGSYTFSIISGSLPPGLSLNSATGVISGTPTTAGTYTFTSQAKDSNGYTDTATCTIVVQPVPIDLECGSCGGGKPTIGTPYSSQLSVIGGTGPFTFSIISGSLPPGLTLNTTTGVISGTPTTAGTYNFTSKVVDSQGSTDTTYCTIVVLVSPVDLQCGSCGSGKATTGVSYSSQLSVTGGKGPYTYSIISGSLPPGLTLNTSTGVISGTPSTAGSYTFTSKVVDANGNTDTTVCTIVVVAPPINLDCGTCGVSNGKVGTAYTATYAVTGGKAPYTFSIITGSLPPGLSLNSSTGVISGTPTSAGTYTFTAKVVDANGSSDTQACTIVITGSTINLDCGTCGANKTSVGASYSAQYSVTGGSGSFTYSIISGSLPPGLSLNSYTGVISGKPTTAGAYTFTAKVVDSRGNSDTQACTIVVTGVPINLSCGSCGSGNGTTGTTYSSQLSVTGGTGPYTYSIASGSLPGGLTLNTSSGVISGNPTTAGSYTFTSKVVDSKGNTDTTTCIIVIVASTINLDCGTCGVNKTSVGASYSAQYSVTGGTGPFTYSITSGSLPSGLSLNTSTGVISGTPTAAGTYTFTAKVVDSKGKSDTAICTIMVQTPAVNLNCGPCSASKAWAGQSYSATMTATGGTGHYTFSVVSGSLPAGLTLNSSTGTISGTPTTPGTYTFTSKALDSNGNSDTDSCTIVVQGTAIHMSCGSCGAGNGYLGMGYSSSVQATGGSGSYTYSIVSGSLPPGLTLNTSTGLISGTPTTAGSYTVTTKAVDSYGNWDTTTCSINILQSYWNWSWH